MFVYGKEILLDHVTAPEAVITEEQMPTAEHENRDESRAVFVYGKDIPLNGI